MKLGASRFVLLSAGLVFALLSVGCNRSTTEDPPSVETAETPSTVQPPEPESSTFELDGITRPLRAGERHFYPLELEANDYVELWAEQLGIDLVAIVHRPDGETLELDSPTGTVGTERLVFIARRSGGFRLEVRAFEDQGVGNYRVELKVRRPADAEDQRRATAAEHFREGQQAVWSSKPEVAEAAFQQARDTWGKSAEDQWWRVETLDRLGRLAASRRDPRSIPLHAEAAALAADSQNKEQEAINRFLLGRELRRFGKLEGARKELERALELYLAQDDPYGQALTQDELGDALQDLGELQLALKAFEQARELWRAQGRRDHEATILNDLGHLEKDLGRLDRARDFLYEADAIWQSLDQGHRRAFTLDLLGQVEQDAGRLPDARHHLEMAFGLYRTSDAQSRATTLANLAQVVGAEGDRQQARTLYDRALESFIELGDRRSAGHAWNNLASLASADGLFDESLDAARRALEIFQEIGLAAGEAEAHHQLSKALRGKGRLHQAREHLEAAVSGFEILRGKARSPTRRAYFFAELQNRYDRYVDLLMELAEDDARWAVSAFEIHERRRARVLLDLLSAPRGGEVELAERDVQRQLNELQPARTGSSESQRSDIERRLRELTDRLAELRARRLPSNIAEPLDANDIRRTVLDPDTVLLAYALGRSRSFLWMLDQRGLVHTAELPPADELETLASSAYQALALRPRREGRRQRSAAICRASRALLGPLMEQLRGPLSGRRLAIMADGALERLAFSALPFPTGSSSDESCPGSFLIESHEVVQLPSASVTAALRRRGSQAIEPRPSVLVVADPIFGPRDPRIAHSTERAATDDAVSLRRLPHTAREAEIVLQTAAMTGRESRALLALAATKANLLQNGMRAFEVLHFATHGVLDPDHPELSSLALSISEEGRVVGTDLFAHEIQGLDLDARLVVLSACQTALGPELRGEGLLGLTRAFFQAGADRLLVSLWNVDDAAGAELMKAFYRYLWIEGLPPAAALRGAQLHLLASSHHQAPYFWAGFVVQGDWR